MQGAGQGTDHVGIGTCKLHGGNTKNARISAREKLAALLPKALTAYESLLEDPDVPASVKRRTAEGIFDRLGMAAATRHEMTGPDGAPMEVDLTVAALRNRLAEVRELQQPEDEVSDEVG